MEGKNPAVAAARFRRTKMKIRKFLKVTENEISIFIGDRICKDILIGK